LLKITAHSIIFSIMPDHKNDDKFDHDELFLKYKDILEEGAYDECEACGGSLTLDKVNLEDYEGGKLYMMEGVPAYVCQECGEVWVPEPIMEEFEKMIETARKRKKGKIIRKENKK